MIVYRLSDVEFCYDNRHKTNIMSNETDNEDAMFIKIYSLILSSS